MFPAETLGRAQPESLLGSVKNRYFRPCTESFLIRFGVLNIQ